MSWVVEIDWGIFIPTKAFFDNENEAKRYAEIALKKGAVNAEVRQWLG